MTTATEIQQLYVAYFNRPADVLGLQFWLDRANANSIESVATEFANSDEYRETYEGQSALEQVNAIYNNLFGRDAETAGLLYWAGKLTRGEETFGSIALTIATSAQNADLVAITNKVAAAEAFTGSLTDADEIIGYSGDAANQVARNWLSGVTDAASLAAATSEAALETVAQAAIDANGGGTTTTPIALTAGADTPAGTARNDVFNALSVNATGVAASTFTSFDVIDGGAGNDTLNIYTTKTENATFPSSATVKNVETVNIFNASDAAALADASKFEGVTALWQINAAAEVTNLGAATTAGLRNIATVGTTKFNATDAAAAASVALANVAEGNTLQVVAGAEGKLAAVNLSGSVADADKDGKTNTNLNVTVGKDVETLTVNTGIDTTLTVTNGAGTKTVSTVNAAASTGGITYVAGTGVANITTGSGKDVVTLATVTVKDTAGTAVNETVTGTVNTGAGDDKITVNVTGDGKAVVMAGEGNDTVNIAGRGTATLDINLGAGDDIFTSAVAIAATDKIDAGAGNDTLLLNLVGSANVGAFSNFDAFDAKTLGGTLDVKILSQKNTVTEIVTTGDVGANAELINLGADVGYRVKADTTVANALKITQATAGALTVTVDIDETAEATTTATGADAAVNATNATSLKAVFDSTFVGAVKAVGDNIASLSITAAEAKSLTVESNGTVSVNDVNIVSAAKLETITVTGASKAQIDVTSAAKLATIDASAATGGLVVSTAAFDGLTTTGGTIKLGSGADVVTVTVNTAANVDSLVGFEKALAAAAGADAAAAEAALKDADLVTFGGTAAVANATTGLAGGNVNDKGVLTFTGSGPATLDAAIVLAAAAAETAGEVLVFEYVGDTYVYANGGALVELTGVTGVTNLVEGSGGLVDHFAIV